MLAVLIGAGIWILSPLLTGHNEPWDASPGYYFGSLFVAGFLLTVIHSEKFYLWPRVSLEVKSSS